MTKRLVAAGLLMSASMALPSSCNNDSLLRAKVIEHRSELIGGPVAMADVGDYLLENDQIRVALLRAVDSPGPGVFGGSLIDVDRRRARIGLQAGQGLDRFAESFPFANMMGPEPQSVGIRVQEDGSNGKEAIIRVDGDGEFFFEALGVLRSKQAALDLLFPKVIARVRFTTDYILRPEARHILIRTTLSLGDDTPAGCPPVTCPNECPNGRAQDDVGCLVCECSEVLPLDIYTEPISMFSRILGDNPNEEGATLEAGLVAGDFVFFGNQNDVFAPGPGFDEEGAVQAAFNAGRNTFEDPLSFDYVAAAGGDISYGYFTVTPPGQPAPVVNVPLLESAATTFLAAGKSCALDAADDAACDRHRTFVFERYLAVGDGDIASVADEVHRVRGTPTGELAGHVLWDATGEAVANARLFVFANPEPGRAWSSTGELTEANIALRGDMGLLNAIDADLGLDLEEDGDFQATMPEGDYVVVARNARGSATSVVYDAPVRVGERTVLVPRLPTPSIVRYRVVDAQGGLMPAKLSFVSLDGAGVPLGGDGLRRPFMGESRLNNGVRAIEWTSSGEGEVEIEAGRYEIVVSRGPEYGVYRMPDVTLAPSQLLRIDALLVREIDTSGWMSADMHLHSTPSFDSGFPVDQRVITVAAEGVELAVATDHDVSTDYGPAIAALGLGPWVASAVGAEITTLEQGHFVGFPLRYDALTVPTHGAHDWVCQSGRAILDGIRATGDDIDPFTIVAHPRDGFFGYIDQLGVDPYTMNRASTLLEADNPVFREAGCNFDGMEIISVKRFDLSRTPTVSEVIDWNRCIARLVLSTNESDLAAACVEIAPQLLVPCTAGERFELCRNKNRTRLAFEMTKRILTRTPIEQANDWYWAEGQQDQKDSQAVCDLRALGDQPVPAEIRDLPCNYRSGQIDDYFRLLEHGMKPTQVASSDSHGPNVEPGTPRTYFRSDAEQPRAMHIDQAVASLKAGHAFATYGPFIRASIGGKTFGEVITAPSGGVLALDLDVYSASWFGVDRVEIYLNGEIHRVVYADSAREAVVDVYGTVSFTVPDRDSWLVVIAMGLEDDNLMGPVALDVAFGDIQLARIVADAFSRIPVVSELFRAPLTVPDWSPVIPYAVTNAIYVDTDGNGVYDAPLPPPDFCSRGCNPADAAAAQCPVGQTCLPEERVCGFGISAACDRRVALGRSE